jgi:hypothetical protein
MRYTRGFLRLQIDTVNRMLGHDPDSVTDSTPRSVHLYLAYGGCGVHYVGPSGRGRDSLLPCVSARECARYLAGMVHAIEIARAQR